jgi:predicted DCC family thiol-disulfide oxidoreductase YuxK
MNRLPVLLYDGPCSLCQRSVRFILRREREPRLHFASLDSEPGRELRQQYAIPAEVDAVVLIDQDGATWGSDAAFRVCGMLKMPWRLFYPLRHLPSPPFQFLYRFVANRRGKWFGRTDDCPLPDPDQAERFL